jgi:hypothetical protein
MPAVQGTAGGFDHPATFGHAVGTASQGSLSDARVMYSI